MVGSNRRAQLTETVTSAVKSAGTLTTVTLVLSAVALLVAAAALVMAARRPGLVADVTRS